MEIVLFIAGSIGFAHILVDGAIFSWLRNWLREPTLGTTLNTLLAWLSWITPPIQWVIAKISEMINCHQCCGFWTGLLCSCLVFSDIAGWQILVGGFAGSFFSMAMAIVFNYLEAQTVLRFPSNDAK